MNLDQAFFELLTNWEELPKKFRDKYRSYRSRFLKGGTPVGPKIKREMLAKYYDENWTKKEIQ